MSRRLFWGSSLLVIGLLLLASNLGYLAKFSVWSLWPILIIWPALRVTFGRTFLVIGDHRGRERVFAGSCLGGRLVALWILAGATAQLLFNLLLIPYNWGFVAYWTLPILLVGVGVAILARPSRRPFWSCVRHGRWVDGANGSVSSLVGEIDVGRHPWDFKSPMRVDVWAGDINIDLTTARFQPGPNYLYVTAWAGDLDIQAPEGVSVVAEVSCSAGQIDVFHRRRSGLGVDLKASRGANGGVDAEHGVETPTAAAGAGDGGSESASAGDETPRVYIQVSLTFGDVRIN